MDGWMDKCREEEKTEALLSVTVVDVVAVALFFFILFYIHLRAFYSFIARCRKEKLCARFV